jgi:hypothetical protein
VRGDARREQRVAIGRRGARGHRSDLARGADTVDHHDRLVVEVFLRVLREIAAGKIRVAARGEGHDERDRLRRIAGLRVNRGRRHCRGEREPDRLQGESVHGCLLL